MRILKKLFGGKRNTPDGSISIEQASVIACAFGEVLHSDWPAPGVTAADASKLPYPKPVIKQALWMLLQVSDDPQTVNTLKVAYLILPQYQDGVEVADVGTGPHIRDSSDPPKTTGQTRVERTSYEKWKPVIDAEFKLATRELRDIGL